MSVRAYGSLAAVLPPLPGGATFPSDMDKGRVPTREVNAALLLNRLWLGADGRHPADAEHEIKLRVGQLTAVANSCQQAVPARMLASAHARRLRAARSLAERRGDAWECRVVTLTPMWRLVVGHGEDSVHESSLTMSQTYGVPVIPGSALKGLAAAVARKAGDTDVTRLFGSPRPEDPGTEAARGSVVIFDALPVEAPKVVVDVLTPHVKPYYDQAAKTGEPTAAPAEYHNPVPVRFLAVQGTEFRTMLAGPAGDAERVWYLLRDGLDEYGIGGKTSAGYGYCTAASEVPA